MTSLTDRYVWATVRSLPEKQRADIERELRASIADAIEARDAAAGDSQSAEWDVLTEMGDPGRLASDYAERPSFLIGPAIFFDFWRLLKLLLAIVPAAAFGGVLLAQTLAGEPFGHAILDAFVTALTAVVHVFFWVTLTFAMLERGGNTGYRTAMKWNPERLPELPSGSRVGVVETLFSVVFLLLFAGVIVWQQFNSVLTDAVGDPIPFINPELWSFWLPYFIALVLLEIVFALVLYRLGRWAWPMAWMNVGLNIAFTVPAVWLLLGDRLFNSAFFTELLMLEAVDENLTSAVAIGASVIAPIIAITAVVIAIWDVVDGFIKAWRSRTPRA